MVYAVYCVPIPGDFKFNFVENRYTVVSSCYTMANDHQQVSDTV